MNPTINTIRNRRSIRNFINKTVKEEDLKLILESATFAASAKNRQAWHFTAICNLQKINELNQALIKASQTPGFDFYKDFISNNYSINYTNGNLFIIVSVDKEHLPVAMQDAALAIGNMMLTAHSLNLGSCWINQLGPVSDEPNFRTILTEFGIPKNFTIAGSLVIGHPDGNLPKAPPRKENTINII